MKFTKKTIYIGLFAILYAVVAFSSFYHACAFFGLANNDWMSIILALAFEIGQAAVLFSLLTSKKDRSRVMPWVLMIMFTLVQVIGNVFSSYKYIINNSVENLRYFKEPIFIWTDIPDDQATVIIVYLVGAILPIAALLLTSMITNYLTDQEELTTINNLFSYDTGPENPPIELHNEEEFLDVYNRDKEDDEIGEDEMSEETKQYFKKKKEDEQRITNEEDQSNNDTGEQPMGTIEDQEETQSSITEDSEQVNKETHNSEDGGSVIKDDGKVKESHFIN